MEPEKKSNGALIGLIIIIVILIVGGIYLWQKNKSKIIQNPQSLAVTKTVTPNDTASLNSLEQDLNTTSTNVDVNVDSLK